MMICPSCGDICIRESRQCPRYDSEPVCIDCCRRCSCYDNDPTTLHPCRWYIDEFDKHELVTLERGHRNAEAVKRMLQRA